MEYAKSRKINDFSEAATYSGPTQLRSQGGGGGGARAPLACEVFKIARF